MFLACGVGAFAAAIFHVITHAFFKALLFLGSGSVIHGMHDEQDMRRMGGLRKYMPITFATMLTGWLAISGIPIFAGFFSKDEILWKTWSAGTFSLPSPAWSKALWFIAALTALLTAVYMTRMMVMTFWGTARFRESHIDRPPQASDTTHDLDHHRDHRVHEPHESPWLMTVPLIVLAILSTVGGLIGVPYALSSLFGGHPENYIERTLEPVIAKVPGGSTATEHSAEPTWLSPPPQAVDGPPAFAPLDEHAAGEAFHSPDEIRAERLLAGVSVLIAALGIAAGWVIFKKRPLLQMPRILENKYYVDEIYDKAIINPIKVGSREGLWKLFDVGVIDGFLHAIGEVVTETGRFARHLQAGFVRGYAAIILLGALAIIGFFTYSALTHLGLVP
jgi:NADH-quinone oxidoreductase subunit L